MTRDLASNWTNNAIGRIRRALGNARGTTETDPQRGDVPLAFDPLAAEFMLDPYPTFRALRERDPVHRSPMGAWVLTRYDDVLTALADPRVGNAPSRHAVVNGRNRHRYVAADVANNIIPFLDEPHHAAPRRLISRAFRTQLRRRPPDIAGIAQQLLEATHDRSEIDVVRDYARPLSVAVLCHLLGISEEDEERLTEWSVWFFYLFSVIPSEEIRRQLDESLVEFRDYFRRAIEEKRRSPRDDLISAMITAGEAEAGLSDTEIADTCMLLFADGVENVDAAVGNAVAALLDHPNELARLRADPTLLPSAVDECLRFETPALFIGRVALAPLSIRGTSIPAQSAILLMLGSANRDPMQFTDPDRLDLGRRPNTHLSFGKGRHSCVGGRLVRLEMRIALGALLESLPEWIPVEGERHWEARLGHRWLSQLRLRTYRG